VCGSEAAFVAALGTGGSKHIRQEEDLWTNRQIGA